jgi:hypothetical protein
MHHYFRARFRKLSLSNSLEIFDARLRFARKTREKPRFCWTLRIFYGMVKLAHVGTHSAGKLRTPVIRSNHGW